MPSDDRLDTFEFSPDGALLMTASVSDGKSKPRMWDTDSHNQVRQPIAVPTWQTHGLELSADGSMFLTVTSGSVRLWDTRTGKQLTAEITGVNAAVFGPDGRGLVTAGGDETVRLWRLPG